MLRSISPSRKTSIAPTAATNKGVKKRAMLPRLAAEVKPSTVKQKTTKAATSTGSIGASCSSFSQAGGGRRIGDGRSRTRARAPLPASLSSVAVIRRPGCPAPCGPAPLRARRGAALAQAQPQIFGAISATSSGP